MYKKDGFNSFFKNKEKTKKSLKVSIVKKDIIKKYNK